MKTIKISILNIIWGAIIFTLGFSIGAYGAEQKISDSSTVRATQKPAGGTSKSAKYVLAPNLIGKTRAQAERDLTKAGLKPGKVLFQKSGKGQPYTVVKQIPTARKRVPVGSKVDLWILRAQASPKTGIHKISTAKRPPRIVQRGKKVYLEFSSPVQNVTIKDKKGRRLQHFNKGSRFDITTSAVKVKAQKINIAYQFVPSKGSPPPPPSPVTHTIDLSHSQYGIDLSAIESTKKVEKAVKPGKDIPRFDVNDTAIESAEPGNNSISGAPLVTHGLYSGEVGGSNDGQDYIRVTAGAGGFGTLISTAVFNGDVHAALWNPQGNFVTGFSQTVYIAIEPNVSVYFSVTPKTAGGTKPYTISVYTKTLVDDNEPNGFYWNATALNVTWEIPLTGMLVNVEDASGGSKVDFDFFKIYLNTRRKIRITVKNVELPGAGGFDLYVYEPNNMNNWVVHDWGTGQITLDVDLTTLYTSSNFPSGNWIVYLKPRTWPKTHDKVTAPKCYRSAGYEIRGSIVP